MTEAYLTAYTRPLGFSGSPTVAMGSWVVGGPLAVRAAARSTLVTDATVTVLDPSAELHLHRLIGAFLAGYRNANTRSSYLQQLHRWFAWCTAHQLDPLAVERTHVELYLRWFERQVGSINTVCHGLSVLASFYRWLVETGLADTTPIAAVRRPSRDETPRQTRLTRHELADWLNTAETDGGPIYAMACLLLLNGLRVSEVCGIDIHGKGDKDATIPLAPRTRAAVEQAIDGRDDGPLLRNLWGNRMSRNNVAAAVARLAREAGIARRMTPHTLRHAAITAALNAGAHLRDVQDFARHADPKTTMRYDRNRHSLDRHATYAIAQYIAGSE
jgi:integrase/recombinase XerD